MATINDPTIILHLLTHSGIYTPPPCPIPAEDDYDNQPDPPAIRIYSYYSTLKRGLTYAVMYNNAQMLPSGYVQNLILLQHKGVNTQAGDAEALRLSPSSTPTAQTHITTCPCCNQATTHTLPTPLLNKWKAGAFIQDVFPNLTPTKREQLITGMCPDCQAILDDDYE
jgi:hypothetical protein